MTMKRRRTAGLPGPYGDGDVEGDVVRTDVLLDALARREPLGGTDAALRLLGALVADVDSQRLSSVSITPST
ncbi:hypothetical protein AB0C10_01915 [Microbispora amethystogenes]|uniref:Anti-sigma-D factor RsdA sigma factor binding region domain-containing protein n=2 Tax=Microbispora TaxID=2005 RepID=A0A5J5K9W5_9ACTN|nr:MULTISPECIES: hypothetical protein [Microbispora]KAA9381780.1 hypothetical protein F5972_02880 [Microbispora cellulosiformans]GIH30778.1 hypothetical protein Mam01_09420 [Microbispora amethystogenes]